MITETDIVNMALVSIGQTPVNSMNDTSAAALAAKSVYYISRDALLRESRWRFALKWVALNQLATAPLNLDLLPNNHGPGSILYSGAYQLPNDCIRVARVSPRQAHWRIVGQQVYTDAIPTPSSSSNIVGTQPPNANGADNLPVSVDNPNPAALVGIEYVSRVTDPQQFDSLFTDCLASKVAMDIAFATSGLESLQDRAEKRYQVKLAEAQAVNGIEQWDDQFWDSIIADVRYGYPISSLGGF
jgi:hypothetical protein